MLIYSYINTRENWKNSKLCENTPPCGRRVSTQFLVFTISTRVDITVYQHGKCFIFLKYQHEWKLEKREIVWKHDARRAECFHTISSFFNFHEC